MRKVRGIEGVRTRCRGYLCALLLVGCVLMALPSTASAQGPTNGSVTEASTPEPERIPQELIERSFPGRETEYFPETIYESVQPIESSASGFVPVPDRWRMFYAGKWYDP